jgi:hypothetical protein
MSSRTILDNNFAFNNLSVKSLIFGDNSKQITAYTGTPTPTPTNYLYDVSLNLSCSTGSANLQNNLIILNSNLSTSSLYFYDASNNPINNFLITFSNTFTSDLIITILNNMTIKPINPTSAFCYIINNNDGNLTYGTINLLTNGNLTINFNNIQIQSTSTFTIYLSTFNFI